VDRCAQGPCGHFEPQIVRKRQRRFEGFDEKILALLLPWPLDTDIEAHLGEIYGVKVGRDLVSKVTDAVMDDARAWQSGPLDDVYPVVFLDALVLKIRDGGSVQRRACYLALAINMDGKREVLGMWLQANEGAKFWMQVLTDLKQHGVQDILICCVDGLKGSRGDRSDAPAHDSPDLHRAPDPSQPEIRAPQAIRAGHQGSQAYLHCRQRRPGVHALEAFEENWGAAAAGDRAGLALNVGARHAAHGRSSPKCAE
jgi:hypothetical protein